MPTRIVFTLLMVLAVAGCGSGGGVERPGNPGTRVDSTGVLVAPPGPLIGIPVDPHLPEQHDIPASFEGFGAYAYVASEKPGDPGASVDSPYVLVEPLGAFTSVPVDPELPEQPDIPASFEGFDAYGYIAGEKHGNSGARVDLTDVPVDPPDAFIIVPVDPVLPEKPAVPVSLAGFDAYENTASIDPRDSWKQTQTIESYFDLDKYLRHPDPSSLKGTLLGSRNGIYYTRQTSGPADTIDINFLWHTEDVPDHVRGIMERAGKAWSYRLKDVFGSHQLKDNVVTRLGRDETGRRTIPYHNDGLLVGTELYSYTSADFRSHQSDGDDFMARSSNLLLSADDLSCCGDIRAGYMAAQQIGHVLGHQATEPRLRPENILRYVDYERGVWTGPAVTEANDGVQVSFEKYRDGTFDFNHLAACRMVMSNCGYDRVIPHEMDFAFLKDLGYTVAEEYPTGPETYSYKAWADHSTWSVTAARALVFDPLGIDDFIGVKVEVAGNPSVAGFADAHSGTVTWNGSLLAADLTTFKPVFGNAEITLSVDTMEGTAAFTGLQTVQQSDRGLSELTGWSNDRLDYAVTATSEGFQDADGRVTGTFYGPSHEEAAGTLHDEVEKIVGAFGGKMASAVPDPPEQPVVTDPPEQPDIPASLAGFDAYENTAAIDPRDSWKQTQTIESYFDLDRYFRHPGSDPLEGTLLGSKNGIYYTQQTSGPADTIDINFLWHTEDVPDHVRGIVERAGKAWSYRLNDVFGSQQSTDTIVTRLGRDETGRRIIRYHNDGILVKSEFDTYSFGGFRSHQIDGDDFMTRSGYIVYSDEDASCCGDVHAGYMAAQQIGHVLGHKMSEPRLRPENILRYVDYERGVWTGPAVTEANGGVPVSFEKFRSGPFNFNHLAACRMVMSNCGYDRVIPDEMDFAFLKDIGYTVADEYPADPETYSYKAWADYSTWSVTAGRALVFDPLGIDDFIGVKVEVTGNPSVAGFAGARSGTVTWSGSLLAADLTTFKPVFGDVEITLSTDTMEGTAAFTDLETVRQSDRGLSELTGWRNERLDYFVRATSNGFQDADGRVTGTFYGPSHEEAAGTLHDEVEKITGAFGGKVSPAVPDPPEPPVTPDPPEPPVTPDPPEPPVTPDPPEPPVTPDPPEPPVTPDPPEPPVTPDPPEPPVTPDPPEPPVTPDPPEPPVTPDPPEPPVTPDPPEPPVTPDPPEPPVTPDPPEPPVVTDPPEPPAIPASLAGFDAYENTAGIDPRDSWKQTQPIQSYFDLARYPRHPNPSALEGTILGSRNGIYYTQQTSGPADTIDINFLWHTEDVPDHVRGIVERAGKAWSYRLNDVFGSHQLRDTVVTRLASSEYGRLTRHNDGLLVKSEFGSYSFGGFRTHQIDGDDFMTRSGYLVYSAEDASCCGDVHAGYMAAQQIGHALGHKMSEPRLRPENILRYVDYERGVWTGPAVTEANGGVQVSFEEYRDGTFDFNHLAACRLVMSNCGYDRVIPHELDFAFLKDIGYTVAEEYPAAPETYSYKAWADHAAWSVTTGRALVFDPLRIDDFIGVKVEVTGSLSVAGFAGARSGTVTWNGSLLATDLTTFKPVFGDAEITLSADTMAGTAAFTGLETVQTSDRGLSELTGWSVDRLDYSVSVTSEGFQDANGRVVGAFYGPSHEEAAGTLHDEAEQIAGAFGGKMAPDSLERSESYVNTAGADPRDTWRPVQPIRSYFGLSQGGSHQDPSRLKGTVLGSGNGITYTQQMSGPTDTIDIDFTGYFSDMPDYVQGILERGGKSWSYRLKDVLGSHQLTDTVVTRLGRDENGWAIPYENDGILLDAETDLENPAWDFAWAYSRGGIRTHQSNGDDFMMRSAWVELSARDIKCCGDVWAGYLAAHEIGHAIGHTASSNSLPEEIRRYADYVNALWTGPALTEANGGVQVPFQRLNEFGRTSPDGEPDFGHLGACPMIMSYCGEDRMIPHDLDFAYMKDIGYTVLDEYPTEPEVYSYGAWAEYSSWSVTVKRALFFDPSRIDDFIAVEAGVMGSPSEASFSNTHIGTVTWNGSLLAADLATFGPVFGGAEITLSADTLDGTVAFTDLKTVRKSNMGHAELSGWRVGRLDYSVSVTSNGFQDADGRVVGALFGPSHEEAAGTLHDEVVRIMGAFGGKR